MRLSPVRNQPSTQIIRHSQSCMILHEQIHLGAFSSLSPKANTATSRADECFHLEEPDSCLVVAPEEHSYVEAKPLEYEMILNLAGGR